jgi:hypothetical protein
VRVGGRSPLDYLASLQARDGHYRYSASSDQTPVWVTGQALLAVSEKPFPLSPVPRSSPNPAPAPVARASGPPAAAEGGAKTKPPHRAKPKPKPAPAAATPAATKTPTAPPLSPASAQAEGEGGGGVPGWLVALALVALGCAAIWGGWVLYRRRLPS